MSRNRTRTVFLRREDSDPSVTVSGSAGGTRTRTLHLYLSDFRSFRGGILPVGAASRRDSISIAARCRSHASLRFKIAAPLIHSSLTVYRTRANARSIHISTLGQAHTRAAGSECRSLSPTMEDKGSAPTSTQSTLLKSVPPGYKKTPVGVNRPGSLFGASLEGSSIEPSKKCS